MKKMLLALLTGLAAGVAGATNFYWNTSVTEGSWSDATNWCTDATLTTPAMSYPKSTADTVTFNDNTKATVVITEKLSIGAFYLNKSGLDLVFRAGGEAKGESILLTMGNNTAFTCTDSTIVLDGVGFYRWANLSFGANSTWKFQNGAYFKMQTPTFASGNAVEVDGGSYVYFNGANLVAGMPFAAKGGSTVIFNGAITLKAGETEVSVSGGSSLTANGITLEKGATFAVSEQSTLQCSGAFNMKEGNDVSFVGKSVAVVTSDFSAGMNTKPSSLTIDDSSITVNGSVYFAANGTGGDVILFKGANPKLVGLGTWFNQSTARANGAVFNFEVPVGGFVEPPLQYRGTNAAFGDKISFYFNVLASSPALADGVGLTECPLYFGNSSTTRKKIDFTSPLNAAGADALSFKTDAIGSAEPTDDASTHCIWAKLGSGSPAPKPVVTRSTGVAGKAYVAVARRTCTVSAYVTALATAGTTLARLMVGESASSLSEALVQPVSEAGLVTLAWTAPEKMLEKTYSFKIVLETLDADGQSVYTEESPVVTGKTVDDTVYTWQPVGGSWHGNFTDPKHWATDTGDDRFDYPQTANAKAVFPKGKMFVTLDRPVSVGTVMADAKDLDLTFVPAEGATTNENQLTITTFNTTKNAPGRITFRNVNVKFTGDNTLGRGKTMLAEGSELYTGKIVSTQGSLYLFRDSHVSTGEIQLGGDGKRDFCGLWIDNSYVDARSHVYAGAGYTGGRLRFSGANPVLYSSGKDAFFQSNLNNSEFVFEFEIPEGGYRRTPICCVSTKTKLLFADGVASRKTYFTVLPTSGALAAAGTQTYTLVDWPKGITAGKCDYSGVVGPEDAFTETAQQISVTIKGAGNAGCVRVTGDPEVGMPDPAYGVTRGHAVGETINCSVASTSFVQDGVSYALAGYVVSNVFEGAESTLLTSGTADSFSYEQPENATVVTWLWTARPTVVVDITEGGTVDYETRAFNPGDSVTITATAAPGYTFARWSGDIGEANSSSPEITLTADRALRVRAEFNCVRYVKTDGDDEADGLSWETALATPQAAADRAVDGDEIVIRAGTYGPYTLDTDLMYTWAPPYSDGKLHPYACCLYLDGKNIYVHSEKADEEVVFDVTASFYDPYWKANKNNAAPLKVFNAPNARVSGLTLKGGNATAYRLQIGLEADSGAFDHLKVFGGTTMRSSVVHLSGTAVMRDSVADGTGTKCGNEGEDHTMVFLRDSALVERCVIRNVRAGGDFYGLRLETADTVARNCLVTGCLTGYSSAGSHEGENNYGAGGAVFVKGGTLANCTITGNETKGVGGGVYVAIDNTSTKGVRLVNNIIYGNISQQGLGDDLYGRAGSDRGRVYCENCCAPEFAGVASRDCLAAVPDFTDAENGDWTLKPGSPLVDKGATMEWMDATSTDLAGNPRVFNDVPDIGAYECQVKVEGIGAGITPSAESGRSPFTPSFTAVLSGDTKGAVCTWDFGDGSATVTGQAVSHTFVARQPYLVKLSVVNAAGDTAEVERLITVVPDVCYVSKEGGHEYPFDTWEKASTNVEEAVAVDAALVLVRPGAYVVPQGSVQVASDIHLKSTGGAAVTILDTGMEASKAGASDPYRVLTVSHPGAVIEGFTLKGGSSGNTYGPIATLQASAGVIRNCVVTDTLRLNRSQSVALTGTAQMTECVINGVIYDRGNGDSSVNAILTLDDDAILDTCTVTNFTWGNYKAHPCAPIICYGRSTVRNTLVAGCTVGSMTTDAADSLSSLIATRGSNVTVENCTLADNFLREGTATFGAAIYVHDGTATIRNNIIWGNETVNSRGSIVFNSGKTAVVDTNCAQEAVPAVATGTIVTDPLFRGKGRRPYDLKLASPCVDTAVPLDWMSGATDVLGRSRVVGDAPDLGCFENPQKGLMLKVR